MSMHDDIQLFREVYNSKVEGYVLECESILAAIGKRHDPSSIPSLCTLFDDEAEFDELMFSIVHAIENCDDETYVNALLKAAPEFCRRTPRWASIVFMRVLNSDATRKALVLNLRRASAEAKTAISELMEKINQRSVQFMEKTTPVIVAASC